MRVIKDELLLSKKLIKECGYESAGLFSLLQERWEELGKPKIFSFRKEEIEKEISLSYHKQKQSLEKLKEINKIKYYHGQGNQIFYTLL